MKLSYYLFAAAVLSFSAGIQAQVTYSLTSHAIAKEANPDSRRPVAPSLLSSAAANLNQARNGTDSLPVSPVNWVNGNVGTANAHYVEEWSAPFQCIMTGLTPHVQVTLVIGYDIRNGGKNAYDYLTHYNRLLPHNLFMYHSTPEVIDPLAGSGLVSSTPYTTYPIPEPSSAGSPVSGQPTSCFNWLARSETLMTLYNGTIDSMYYVSQGSLTAANSETQIAVKFTPSAATTVLAWGAHIASRNVWGYTAGIPNSAGGISGSPFHMRLDSWSLGNLGNTDRSIAGPAVGPPAFNSLPIDLISFTATARGKSNMIEWNTASEVNNDYFTVERSKNGSNFSELGKVNGIGNSSVAHDYSFSDNHPLSGVSYYRLKQTDIDGNSKVFYPVSVFRSDASTAFDISILPNPFDDEFTAQFYSDEKKVVTVDLMSIKAKIICTEAITVEPGVNSYHFIHGNLLDSKVYILRIRDGNTPLGSVKLLKR